MRTLKRWYNSEPDESFWISMVLLTMFFLPGKLWGEPLPTPVPPVASPTVLAPAMTPVAAPAVIETTMFKKFKARAHQVLNDQTLGLAEWQKAGFQRGLELWETRTLVLTAYWPAEGPDSTWDRRSRRCTLRTAASNKLQENGWIWTPETGLRQILDCGSKNNDKIAKRVGGTWVDIWYPRPSQCEFTSWGGYDGIFIPAK